MLFSLIKPLREIPVAFVDVETTGASADYGDRVTELGIVRIEAGRIVGEYQQLVDPERRISPGVVALTGITQEMVTGQPRFGDQLPAALAMLRGAAVVGHNVRFDLSFLNREFRRAGSDLCGELGDAPVFDTVRIARRQFGRSGNGLQRFAPRLGIQPSGAHRALADAQTTAAVFEKLLIPLGHYEMPLCDVFMAQGGPMGLLPANAREAALPIELQDALDQRRPVRMTYVDGRGKETIRSIDPIRVRRTGGELILLAHCHLRGEQRTFKVDRIVRFTDLATIDPTAPIAQLGVPGLAEEPDPKPPRPAAATRVEAEATLNLFDFIAPVPSAPASAVPVPPSSSAPYNPTP